MRPLKFIFNQTFTKDLFNNHNQTKESDKNKIQIEIKAQWKRSKNKQNVGSNNLSALIHIRITPVALS